MSNLNKQIAKTFNSISNNTKSKEELYVEYLKASIAEGEEDIKNGRFMSIEESIERMKEKYENYNIVEGSL